MHAISSKHLTFSLQARIEWSILLQTIEQFHENDKHGFRGETTIDQ